MSDAPNADQIAFWNGPTGQKWTQFKSDMDRNLADASAGVLALAAARPGERVLDIGCGSGKTTLALAKAVGAAGHVMGVDVSEPLLSLAKTAAAALPNVAFVHADASRQAFEPVHDLLFSRFGVMFFDDPSAAFANIRTALKPGGRLAFVCWRPAAENEWVSVCMDAARPLLPEQPAPDPHAPGPFAFADPKRVEAILTKAGFDGVTIDKLDGVMNLGRDVDHAAFQMTNLGPLSRALNDADDATRARVMDAVRAAFAKIATPEGVRPGIACWLVSARA
jgi:SAM-dependent methyltransferase